MNARAHVCLLVLALCGAVPAAPAPPPDKATQDAINEIDSAMPRAAPVGKAPGTSAASQATSGGSQQQPGLSWLPLLRLFAPALATAGAMAVAGAVCGTFVLLRREALVALALPQVVAVGAAVGMRYAVQTLPPALVAAVAAVAYLVATRRRGSGPWVLPALYVAGLSISFLVIANKGQDVADLQKLFTGVDVAVAPADAAVAVPVLVFTAALVALLWRRWLLVAQAPAAAELAGLRPARWDALFLVLLATTLLVGTNALGVVMVLAMLFLPAAAALPWSRSIPLGLGLAVGLAVTSLVGAFVLANEMSWPLSQTVGGIGAALVGLSHLSARHR